MALIEGTENNDRLKGENIFPFWEIVVINGNAGNDYIEGSFLNPNKISGGTGNDTIYGGTNDETLIGGIGNDSIRTSTSSSASLSGGDGDDILFIFGFGSVTLDGGSGDDYMVGGDLGDTFIVDSVKDTTVENFVPSFDNLPNPTDLVISTVSWKLGDNLENLILSGTSTIDGVGTQKANLIIGNSAKNKISGLAGNDSLQGGGGDDTLDGGEGVDVAVYAGAQSDYQIIRLPTQIYVRQLTGDTDGQDTLQNIERLQFSDSTLEVASLPSALMLAVAGSTVKEGNFGTSVLSYTITLSETSTTAVTFNARTSGGTATIGSDYSVFDQNFTIGAGSKSATINVELIGDTRLESDETITLTVSQVSGAFLADGAASITATGSILNDDYPSLSLATAGVSEGDSGTANLVYTITLSEAAVVPVTFTARTNGGTASVGSDYKSLDQVVTIMAGSRTATIPVSVTSDKLVERDETVILTLSQVSGATLANNATSISATGTIKNDDSLTLSVTGGSVTEGTSGTSSLSYTITLSEAALTPVTFTARTGGGTATAGSDYTALDRTITIAAGATSAAITIDVIGDTLREADETLVLTLSQVTGAILTGNATSINATGTIVNDDVPSLSISSPTLREGFAGPSTLTYTVTLSETALTPVTFTARTGGGTATSGSDYTAISQTFTIAAGQKTAAIAVTVAGDTHIETDETIVLTLSQVSGAVLANGAATLTTTGTITNDDQAAGLALSYKMMNADLALVFGDDFSALAQHYISYGRAEGRPIIGFDPEAYAALNPDLFTVFGLDNAALADHFLRNGRFEGRKADGFDALAYAAVNPDLFAVFGTDRAALVNHFVHFGQAEGRKATGFDVEAYAALNPDLFSLFGLDEARLINHYVKFGKAENRKADGFDAEAYAILNPDLFAVFGLDHPALITHYIQRGAAEGRSFALTPTKSGFPSRQFSPSEPDEGDVVVFLAESMDTPWPLIGSSPNSEATLYGL